MRKPQPAVAPRDPLWYKDAIIYQLHVKSFFDANDDGIGDFRGVTVKLDYIADLGVDTLWLLPFYPSPRRDDGYDISDYRDVHPDYGSIGDLQRLIRAAHERGLKVVTELVINHTSDQHGWFQRARQAKKDSPYRQFYVWSDTDQAYADTRIIFIDTEKSNWTWDATAGAYFWHRFYAHQPDLNFDNPRVLKEVMAVMRFWLDLGIDGLRLDAVPYLVEREGTNNENLPETHAVLKLIRAEMDRKYQARMLLAEANQWPEDARQYFGDGDECHMAFHFPLMPRIYMAIAQEDRFPISDILRQTPQLPENCQWAVFLRNHDELTLEMVTDRERDYLWNAYASDRRARLNLGIRRRLSPLVEHDRRRIELMNGLLLSMPGTPVIYYGDEIGMGDNIHLGDRDGVRTPMQWSPDRNGGFSRANPAQLVLPPIMDPVYGFQAVNVEAQSSDPHSLLNWMRRMLTVRRQEQSFGRGDFKLLSPGNRKILAYLRSFDQTLILCVNNLSRTAQAVELDLAAFAGRIPVDIVGSTSFPPVGQLPYLLTLPPYGFYWFCLAVEADLPKWHKPAPEPLPEYVTLVLRRHIDEIFAEPIRQVLETEVLPAYLGKRRWYAAKNLSKAKTTLPYGEILNNGKHPLLLSEIDVEIGGRLERYQVPLGILWEEEIKTALPQQLALARIRIGRHIGILTDALSIESFPLTLLDHLRKQSNLQGAQGNIAFIATQEFDAISLSSEPAVHYLAAEQSNSSVIIDEKVLIKLLRRVESGIHPEVEFGRHLAKMGFHNTAPLLGEITRTTVDGTRYTLALVQGF
ncbi:MAG TPA: maltose alpha-D-glucosyltransferase, partial [Dongiaceae bacterium]